MTVTLTYKVFTLALHADAIRFTTLQHTTWDEVFKAIRELEHNENLNIRVMKVVVE